jgi:hypothetical protein
MMIPPWSPSSLPIESETHQGWVAELDQPLGQPEKEQIDLK